MPLLYNGSVAEFLPSIRGPTRQSSTDAFGASFSETSTGETGIKRAFPAGTLHVLTDVPTPLLLR